MDNVTKFLLALKEVAEQTGIVLDIAEIDNIKARTERKARGHYEYMSEPFLILFQDEYKSAVRSMIYNGDLRRKEPATA